MESHTDTRRRCVSKSESGLKSDLENILCHVQVGREEDSTCLDKYATCRDSEIGDGGDDNDGNNFNSTMGKDKMFYC